MKFAHQVLSPGEYWAEVIEEEIRRAENILIVLSENSVNSDWMRAEAAVAIAQGEKRIVPVYSINNVEVPFMLRAFRGVDLSDPESYRNSLDELATLLLEKESPRVSRNRDLALFMHYTGRQRDSWTSIEKLYLYETGKHQKVWGNQAAHGSTSADLAPAFSRIPLLELLRSVPSRVRVRTCSMRCAPQFLVLSKRVSSSLRSRTVRIFRRANAILKDHATPIAKNGVVTWTCQNMAARPTNMNPSNPYPKKARP